ncbi:MAG: hypothetical protein U0271_31575 [Polyangiaceae bacterium]
MKDIETEKTVEENNETIELVDIEDLRTAFGGQAAGEVSEKAAKYPTYKTTGCSGWN